MNKEQAQDSLLNWYNENKRDLPWRKTKNPYEILVSEIMLQQTQVDRVIPKYREFLHKFPTAEVLASAPLADVLKVWKGLGYNRRAKLLQDAAKRVMNEFHGKFPESVEELTKLPGIGPYTAHAVLSFAFERGGPVFDANVRRVFYRLKGAMPDKELMKEHEALFDPQKSLLWNNAIMEFGALVCRKGTPLCNTCVWRDDCKAWKKQDFVVPPASKQSKFEGSFRQYRAKVLHFIVEKGGATKDLIASSIPIPVTHSLDRVLAQLLKEKIIRNENGHYFCS